MINSLVQERTSDDVSIENINTNCTELGKVHGSHFPISQQTTDKTSLNSSTLEKNTRENTVHDMQDAQLNSFEILFNEEVNYSVVDNNSDNSVDLLDEEIYKDNAVREKE